MSCVGSASAGCDMRPRGEIRQALADAAERLHEQLGPVTWRDMAAAACVGFAAAKATARNMEAAGELAVQGTKRVPGVCRPMKLYAPRRGGWVHQGAPLADAMRGWVKG